MFCVRPEVTMDDMLQKYHRDGDYYPIIAKNVRYVKSSGFNRFIDVRGDGNCFIYAILVYLRHTRNINIFMTILLPFCNEAMLECLLTSVDKFMANCEYMHAVAYDIRNNIVINWDYIGVPEYHMNNNAIDGLAREMVMRLLGVDEIICYSLIPDNGEKEIRVMQISPNKSDLRPDIPHKWKVTLLSPSGYTHYGALLA